MNNFKTNISFVLQSMIETRRLSISDLARRTCIPQPTLHRIAHGQHQKPHKKTLEILSDFFNITIDQLLGWEPIENLTSGKLPVSQLPILNCDDINSTHSLNTNCQYLIYEKPISKNAFAIKMPDKSMEPLIIKDSLLIVDREKKPEYRNLIVVKLHNYEGVLIRQLINDACNSYIRPLSQDFKKFEMIMLTPKDNIIGTIVEVRFDCEAL